MKIRPGIHGRGDSAHACSYLLDVCVKCTVQTCLVVPRKYLGMIYSLLSLCDMVSLLSREPLRSGLAAQRVGRLQMFRGSRFEAHKIAMPFPFMSFKVHINTIILYRTRKKPCSASPSSRGSLRRSYSHQSQEKYLCLCVGKNLT